MQRPERRLPENCNPEERRLYRKYLHGLLAFYAALMIVAAGIVVGNLWFKNLAYETAVAEPVGEKSPTSSDAPTPMRQATK